jgi:hypothetical protein
MTYHPLANNSGSDDSRRREEAAQLVSLLSDHLEELSPSQRNFVEEMGEGGPVSVKQLYFLRDLWEKFQ